MKQLKIQETNKTIHTFNKAKNEKANEEGQETDEVP